MRRLSVLAVLLLLPARTVRRYPPVVADFDPRPVPPDAVRRSGDAVVAYASSPTPRERRLVEGCLRSAG